MLTELATPLAEVNVSFKASTRCMAQPFAVGAVIVGLLLHFAVAAGPLPQANRTAFKCERDGKVIYTDTPCEGGQRVDTQSTSGMNTSSVRPVGTR